MKSPLTTLCYLEKNGCYLMMHRNKKKEDANKEKWIGIGGHFEEGESPEECLVREVREETGLLLRRFRFRGLVTFVSDRWDTEYMCLYTGSAGEDAPVCPECTEGELKWIAKEEIGNLNLWEGDRIFLRLLAREVPFFSLKLCYEGDHLKKAVLDGEELPL